VKVIDFLGTVHFFFFLHKEDFYEEIATIYSHFFVKEGNLASDCCIEKILNDSGNGVYYSE
jgi:hypothetical protein